MNYFDTKPVGEVLSRVTNDIDTLGQSLNQSATQMIQSVTTLIGVLIMMLTISPLMTLVTLIILPISMLLIGFVMKHSQKYFRGQQEYLGNVNGQVEEVYSGHSIIKAFNKEENVIDEFDATNDKLYDSAWKSQFFSGMMMPIMQFIGNLGYVVVAILGGFLTIKKTIEVGDIQSFIQYVRSFTQPIQQIAQVANMLQMTAAASERVFEFLEEVRQITPDLKLGGIVITKVDTRKSYFKQTLETLKSLEDVPVFDTYIRVDSGIEWSQDNNAPIMAYKKSSRSATEYMELTKEIAKME